MSRWKGMDEDISDDQQDIARGRGMVDSKFQGGFGLGGTQVRLATPSPARDRTRCISRNSAFVLFATDFSPEPEGPGALRDRLDRARGLATPPRSRTPTLRTCTSAPASFARPDRALTVASSLFVVA